MVVNATKIILDRENLFHNMDFLKRKSKGKKILPIVKANAYGHGMDEIVGLLYEYGQREFAVARYLEGERIRKMGYEDVRVLVFESIGNLDLVKDKPQLDITANTLDELKEILAYGISPDRIQIKIDLGFGRNGIFVSEVDKLKEIIDNEKGKFRGLYSHLFTVEYDDGFEYIEKFNKVVEKLGKDRFEMIHLQNTPATLSYGCDYVTHVRSGMGVYGLHNDGFYERNYRQVFSLETQIAGVKDLEDSKYIAYRLRKDEIDDEIKYIGKIKIGYGDGFLKSNEGSTCLIGNKEYKILQVTMDNTFLKVDSRVKEGDKVQLYYNVPYSTQHNDMPIYQLLSILSPRIERVIK